VDWDKALGWLRTRTGASLAPEQKEAVRLALTSRVAVLAGGPGSGKSFTVRSMVELARARGSDEDEVLEYGFDELDELAHVYAITIHRSQASEYPAVVIALTTGSSMMLRRNLLYTGVTRAKKLVVLAGSRRALSAAIRTKGTGRRHTVLAHRLRHTGRQGASIIGVKLITSTMPHGHSFQESSLARQQHRERPCRRYQRIPGPYYVQLAQFAKRGRASPGMRGDSRARLRKCHMPDSCLPRGRRRALHAILRAH
jgi:superfamily I DNA/RNA helicase